MFDSIRGPVGVVKRRCARRFWHVALREVSGAIDGSLRAWRDRWVAPCVARSMGRSVRGATLLYSTLRTLVYSTLVYSSLL